MTLIWRAAQGIQMRDEEVSEDDLGMSSAGMPGVDGTVETSMTSNGRETIWRSNRVSGGLIVPRGE